MTTRRKLLGVATLGAAGAALSACGGAAETEGGPASPAVVKRRTRLTMTTTWPKDLPGLGAAANRLAERIEQLSEGQMTVKVYAAGELVPAFQAFDAVADGSADMYHAAEYYWQAKSKAFNFYTAVPMGMTAAEIMGWVDFGGGQELWEELSGQFGVIAFQGGNS
ncbi:MAG: ABC transporter substrate-binding protein, partial [Hyphomonadaceae bacterium]